MVNEKDVMRKLKYFAGIAAALMLWGCSEDKFVPDQYFLTSSLKKYSFYN